MDVKERLVYLVKNALRAYGKDLEETVEPYEFIADFLIHSGVTVQEWISVYDELPEVGGYVVCIAKRNPFSRFMPMAARIEKNGWVDPMTEQYISEVTHWMPMPNPPKGAYK